MQVQSSNPQKPYFLHVSCSERAQDVSQRPGSVPPCHWFGDYMLPGGEVGVVLIRVGQNGSRVMGDIPAGGNMRILITGVYCPISVISGGLRNLWWTYGSAELLIMVSQHLIQHERPFFCKPWRAIGELG